MLTDIDGSYVCMCDTCRLYDASGLRLAWRTGNTGYSSGDFTFQRNYTSGVRFGPGAVIAFDPPTLSACTGFGFGYSERDGPDTFNGNIAFMGRLVSE